MVKFRFTRWLAGAIAVLALAVMLPVSAHTSGDKAHRTGILVVAPDRGWLGNEEIRDAFASFAQARNAQLLLAVDARSRPILARRLQALRAAGATQVIVLPLVLSAADPRWQRVKAWLDESHAAHEAWQVAPAYGESYLAVEDLSARLRALDGDHKRLLLLGYGADSVASSQAMQKDLARIGRAATTLNAGAVQAVVYPARKAGPALRKAVETAIQGAHGAAVVPVAMAPRDDSMMDFSHWFARDVPHDATLVESPLATPGHLAQWMARASNKAALSWAPASGKEVGVVALAHGADWFWNRAIMQSLTPVTRTHKVAWAFSMADQPVVERAVRRLEKQHVRGIVVVRAFSRADSFLPSVERMLGLDVARHKSAKATSSGMGMMMHGHAGPASLGAPPRIRTALPVVTVGGVEGSPLLAKALLANAREVSTHPARETVIMVAHGLGDDAANRQWLGTLGHLATLMKADGGDAFRAIKVATWREDWPDKRKQDVAAVRAMFPEAQKDHGRVLIVPARINGRGRADDYLKGLDFGWAQGFAQTPYFARWFEQQITEGTAALNAGFAPPASDQGVARRR